MTTKVHYFAAYGAAESIRMLLAHAKVEFENHDYNMETLPAAKASGNLEFGQVPVLEVNGKFYCQSNAILRFLGAQHGYYSEDPYTGWQIDSIIDSVGDLMNAYYKAAYGPEAEREALTKAFYETSYPKWAEAVQKRLQNNTSQKFIVGDKLTIADFKIAALAHTTFLNEANPNKATVLEVVEKFPVFLEYCKGLGEELKAYLSTRQVSSR